MKRLFCRTMAAIICMGIVSIKVYAGDEALTDTHNETMQDIDAACMDNDALYNEGVEDDPLYIKLQMDVVEPIGASFSDGYSGSTYYHSSALSDATVRNGIDVSRFQGVIDWGKVKNSGIDFAFIRVAYRGYESGALVADPAGAGNITAAVAEGIKVGVYIFSQAITVEEAVAEADFAIDNIGSNEITLPVVIDFEYVGTGVGRLYNAYLSNEQKTEIINAFCDRVRERGYTPMVYASKNMLENDVNASQINADIWLANYTTETQYQGTYSVWQYTSSGYVDGINGTVDCNFAYDYGDEYAYEQTIKDGIYYIKLAANTDYMLDISGASGEDCANLQLWEYTGSNAQQFEIKYLEDGKYLIKALCSGKYIDAQGLDIKAGTNVAQYTYNGGNNQMWYIESQGDNTYRIRSVANQMCLDAQWAVAANGTSIILWTSGKYSLQTFKLEEYVESNTDYTKEGYNGWYEQDGKKYWYDYGVMARDKEAYDPDSDAWYWFDADGSMAVDKDVFIPTSADRSTGKWVRYDVNGAMVKGEDYRYGGWYWFDPITGEMQKGFAYIPVEGSDEGKWVYYDLITGQMYHGASCIDGNWYYFDEYTGKMAHGESYHDGNWYYYDDITGIMRYGEVTLANGETAYYDEVTGVRR